MLTLTKRPETRVQKSDCSVKCGWIIAMLEIMKEDIDKEMRESIADDQANQVGTRKTTGALGKMLDAQRASKVEMEKNLEDLEQQMQETRGTRMKDQ